MSTKHFVKVDDYCPECTYSIENFEEFCNFEQFILATVIEPPEIELKTYTFLVQYPNNSLYSVSIWGCKHSFPPRYYFRCLECSYKLINLVESLKINVCEHGCVFAI